MPDIYRLENSAAVSVGASTTKSVLGKNAPSAQREKIKRWKVQTDAGAATDAAIIARLVRTSTAGTSTARTPNPTDPAASASNGSGGENYTAEPTKGTEIDKVELPTAGGGVYEKEWPDGREPRIAAGGRYVVEITTGGQTRLILAEVESEE